MNYIYVYIDVFDFFSKIFQKYLKNISPKVVLKVVKKQTSVARVILFAFANEIFNSFWVPRNHKSLHFKLSKNLKIFSIFFFSCCFSIFWVLAKC
jgi:hypothetical protein